MDKRRNNIEIMVDILEVALDGAKKSKIVYRANLNFKIVNDFLATLEDNGLLTESKGKRRMYQTTEKGIDYINHYRGLKAYLTVPGE